VCGLGLMLFLFAVWVVFGLVLWCASTQLVVTFNVAKRDVWDVG
jgi:hypothetical protein